MSLLARVRAVWLSASDESGRAASEPEEAARFESRIQPHLPGWIQLAKRVLGDLATAEEVVYQSLGKLWTRLQNEAQSVENLSAYGARIVLNAARDHLRTQRRRALRESLASHGHVTEFEPSLDPLEKMLSREVRAELDAAVARLDEEDRLVIELHAFNNLTFAQVAQRVAVSTGRPRSEEWAKKRYQRAALKLRDATRRALGGEGE